MIEDAGSFTESISDTSLIEELTPADVLPLRQRHILEEEGISDSSSECCEESFIGSFAAEDNLPMNTIGPFSSLVSDQGIESDALQDESTEKHVDQSSVDSVPIVGPFTSLPSAVEAIPATEKVIAPFTSALHRPRSASLVEPKSPSLLKIPIATPVSAAISCRLESFQEFVEPVQSETAEAMAIADDFCTTLPEDQATEVSETIEATVPDLVPLLGVKEEVVRKIPIASAAAPAAVTVLPPIVTSTVMMPIATAVNSTLVPPIAAPMVSIRARSGSVDLTLNRSLLTHTTTSSSATSSTSSRSIIRSVGSTSVVEEKESAERWRDRLWPSRALTSFCRSITRCIPPVLTPGKNIFSGEHDRDGQKKVRLTPHWNKTDLKKVVNTYETLSAHNAAFFLLLVEESRESSMQDSSEFEVIIHLKHTEI
jgi:hypothetical protein